MSTAAFLVSMALVVLFTRLPFGDRGSAIETRGMARKAMATSLVVYFVAVVDLLLIAQQVSLALGTFVTGLVLLVVYYIEPAIRTRGSREGEDQEGWER